MDRAVFSQSCQAGVGVVIRYYNGEVIVKQTISLAFGTFGNQSKNYGGWDFICLGCGLREMIFECDSKIVSSALLGL